MPSQFDDRYDSIPAASMALRIEPADDQQPGVGGFLVFLARLGCGLIAFAIAVYALSLALGKH